MPTTPRRRPFQEWRPEQRQPLLRHAASLRLTLNNRRHPLPVPAHGRGLSQRGDESEKEVLDMTGEVMPWISTGEVGPRNARIERTRGDASARGEGSSRCRELFGAATSVGA